MDVDLIFKIGAIGIIVAMLNTVMKQAGKEEQGHLITLVGVVVVLIMVIQMVQKLFLAVRTLFGL